MIDGATQQVDPQDAFGAGYHSRSASKGIIMHCPKCHNEMTNGFSCANSSISWIDEGQIHKFIFKDKDLADSGFKSLFPWKGTYFHSAKCQICKVIIIDYSVKLSKVDITSKNAESGRRGPKRVASRHDRRL